MEVFKSLRLFFVAVLAAGMLAGCYKKPVDTTLSEPVESEVPADAEALEPEVAATPDADDDLTVTEQAVLTPASVFSLISKPTRPKKLKDILPISLTRRARP